jgi:amino acid adenylation domain-containing protein
MLSEVERAALAQRLRRGRDVRAAQMPRRATGLTDLPLSFGQEQLWFIDRFAPGLPTYNIPLALRLSGPLDTDALSRGLDGLIARHEALRTRLVPGERGQPVQRIDPPEPLPLELADLSGATPDDRQARLRELIDIEALRPFDLANDRLLRAWLVRLTSDEHVLVVVVHHTVFDGWSTGVFVREAAALYRQEATGEPSGLAELPVQFADYALWERDHLTGPALAQLQEYWQGALQGFQTVHFPTDRPRPALDSFDGGLAQQLMSPELLAGLRELSRREGATLHMLLIAALQVLLLRCTGQTDIVIGTVSASRTRPELTPLIGFLVNTLPIRTKASPDLPFTELLARVREATVGAFAHQDLPFAKIVQTLRAERDPGRSPVFQIALSYGERDGTGIRAAGVEFTLTDLVVGIDAAKFDLDFAAEARADGLWLECSYKTALFDPATVRRLLGHFEVLLRGVVADPSAPLSQLPVLTGAELHRELTQWNDTAGQVPPACVHQGFADQAASTPDAVAAELAGERMTYAELNREANQIARRLRDLGVGPEILVGVCMATGLRRLAALLGIWKAGGGYVPLDPALPTDRLSFMIADAGIAIVVTDKSGAERVHATAKPDVDPATADLAATAAANVADPAAVAVLCLDAEWEQIRRLADTDRADTAVTPANVAYVIYTSGSTGQPKGVVVEHRQAVNFLHGMIGHWRIGPSDVVLQFASLSFDASVQEMFMPLLGGARVVLAPAGTLHSPRRLAALIRDRRITFACLTPSVVSLLGEEQFPDLRVLMCGGEELPSELVRRWLRPGLSFVNDYGPTETTITAAFMELTASTPLPPPIGRPSWPNYRAYVLDPDLNPVPVGVTGELHIGGAGVARGYLNRPGLTTRRFIADPFAQGQRLYKTGDLARRRPDGTIVFAGRIDHQVKIAGLRIELGEIETALAAHPAIAQAVVAVSTGATGDKRLTGYLRPRPGAEPDPADVRAHLARTMPGYMIPAHLITVESFPLNTSGKIDRAALPAPGYIPAAAERLAPGTVTETVLVELYGTVLNSEQVGTTDSFFNLGGSSLAAMRLIDLINDQLGVDVGVATIFLHPTPSQLAASIDAIRSGASQSAGSGPIIDLSAGPGELPLYLIHAVGGTAFAYAQLARELAGTFKVYGIEAPGLNQAGITPTSLSDLVRDYTERIRTTQPVGPYRLAGWSMGGVVAFEIARQLEQSGAEVSALVLLDAPFAIPPARTSAEPQLAGQFVADAIRSLGWDAASAPDPSTSTAAEQIAWLAARLRTDDSDGTRDTAAAQRLKHRFDIFGAHTRMLAGYTAAPAGPATPVVRAPTLIVSADRSLNAPARTLWPRALSGPVSTLRIDGDHYTFLQPPLVAEVSASILKWQGDSQ